MRLKKIISIFIIGAILLSLSPFRDVRASVDLPKTIKIGLFYSTDAKASYQLSSSGGFSLGYEDNAGNLVNIFNTNVKNVIINKDDDYYLVTGKYNDLKSMDSDFSKISSKVSNVMSGYDGSYHIYIGPYKSQNDANTAFNSLINNFSDLKIVLPDKNISVSDGSKIIFLFNMKADLYVYKANPSDYPLGINSKHYRGMFEFRRQQNSDMTAINVVSLEEYLYGVVPAEMPASWNIEALKAQAVVSRTYAAKNIGRYGSYGFDLTDDVYSQVYKGYDGENPLTNKAVDETKGIVAIYQGSLIDALFHSHSGGYTEDNNNYFSADVPYLKGVEDKYVFGYNSADDSWTVTCTKEQIKDELLKRGQNIGDVQDVKVTDKSWTGRAITVTIYGTNGTYTLSKGQIRSFFGTKSTMLTITGNGSDEFDAFAQSASADSIKISLKNINIASANGIFKFSGNTIYVIGQNGATQINPTTTASNVYTINGSGYGHGVGLSQYGARGLADHGYNYIAILKYYYKGIDIYDSINNKII